MPAHRAIDQHTPPPDEPVTTPAQLGYPHGVYLDAAGTVHDGTRDGYLAHAAHDTITVERARELGLIRPSPPVRERRRKR